MKYFQCYFKISKIQFGSNRTVVDDLLNCIKNFKTEISNKLNAFHDESMSLMESFLDECPIEYKNKIQVSNTINEIKINNNFIN